MSDKDGDVEFGPGPALPVGTGAPAQPGLLFPQGVAGPLVSPTNEEMGAANAASASANVFNNPAALANATVDTLRASRHARMNQRRQAAEARLAEVQAAEAQRTAARKALVASRLAAKAAAAASAAGEQGAGLKAFQETIARTASSVYAAASENLIPLLMLSKDELNEPAPSVLGLSLNDLFTKKLSAVCDMVFGRYMREELGSLFTSPSGTPSIRNFFEFESPGEQCNVVIGPKETQDRCWLCKTPLALAEKFNACEHKLPVILALLLTGLYDRTLYTFLTIQGRGEDYINLLKLEYGWAHQRCNQFKGDLVFLTPEVGRDKVVTFGGEPGVIGGYVQAIRYATSKYEGALPPLKDLQAALGKKSDEDVVNDIVREYTPLVQKLNRKKFTTKQLMSHFIRGLMERARILAPALAAKGLKDRLNGEQKKAVVERLRGTTTGGKTRRVTRRRRRQRGGAEDADEILSSYVFDRIKEGTCGTLFDSTTKFFLHDVTAPGFSETLTEGILEYINATDDAAARTIAAIPEHAYFAGGTDDEVLDRLDRFLTTGVKESAPAPGAPAAAAAASPPGYTTPAPASPRSAMTVGVFSPPEVLSPGSSVPGSPVPAANLFAKGSQRMLSRQGSVASGNASAAAAAAAAPTLPAGDIMEDEAPPPHGKGRIAFGPKPDWF